MTGFGTMVLTFVETGQVGSLSTRVGDGTHVPVDTSLPGSIVESVEEVEEHGTDILLATISPINSHFIVCLSTGNSAGNLILLPGPAAAPDDKGQDEKTNERSLGANTSADVASIEGITEDHSTNNLR